MSRERDGPMRILSILVAFFVASILAYAYQMNLPSLIHDGMSELSQLVFVTIPLMTGFITGIIYPKKAILDGLYVGLLSAIVNSIMTALKLLFKTTPLTLQEISTFTFFMVMSIFLWMFITAASTLLAKALIRELSDHSSNPSKQKETGNPYNSRNSDMLNCPHYAEYLASVSTNTPIPDVCLTCEKATRCLEGKL